MAKAHRKAQERLERRIRAYEVTKKRQDSNNFRPNMTGGQHQIHRPGSTKKAAPRGRR